MWWLAPLPHRDPSPRGFRLDFHAFARLIGDFRFPVENQCEWEWLSVSVCQTDSLGFNL